MARKPTDADVERLAKLLHRMARKNSMNFRDDTTCWPWTDTAPFIKTGFSDLATDLLRSGHVKLVPPKPRRER